MEATVPLLLEDVELGLPPTYEEAANGKQTLQNRSLQQHCFFNFNSSKATTNLVPVIFSTIAIRLGTVLFHMIVHMFVLVFFQFM